MPTVTITQLVPPTQLGNTDVSVYLTPNQTTIKIGRAVFTNNSASPTTITAGITTGGSLGPSNTFISAMPIAPGAAYVSPELAGAVLTQGEQLHAYAGAANAVAFIVSGITIV